MQAIPSGRLPLWKKEVCNSIPPELRLQCSQQLRKLPEIPKLLGMPDSILRAGRGQDEDLCAVQQLLLMAQLAAALREVFVGGLSVEGNHLGRVLLELLAQDDTALGKFLAGQLLDAARRPFDQVRQTDPKLNHPLV